MGQSRYEKVIIFDVRQSTWTGESGRFRVVSRVTAFREVIQFRVTCRLNDAILEIPLFISSLFDILLMKRTREN